MHRREFIRTSLVALASLTLTPISRAMGSLGKGQATSFRGRAERNGEVDGDGDPGLTGDCGD